MKKGGWGNVGVTAYIAETGWGADATTAHNMGSDHAHSTLVPLFLFLFWKWVEVHDAQAMVD